MKELAGRLTALDPDAGAALRVISYFDELIERRAGLESMVRGAAVLSGHRAVLVDLDRGLRLLVTPDGVRRDGCDPAPDWCRALIAIGITLWLEHPEPAGPVEAMVLERASLAARSVLDRTRDKEQPSRRDAELREVLLDATASEAERLRAARWLGVPADAHARVVASPGRPLDVRWDGGEPSERAGVGPAVPVLELPATVDTARTAARFTAEGGPLAPGPRVVYADDLGGLLLLAAAMDADPRPVPDVVALERAATAAPWLLLTLEAVASHASLRGAASALHVHHSTLQERMTHAEQQLGWSLRDVPGRLRLTVALMLLRLAKNDRA